MVNVLGSEVGFELGKLVELSKLVQELLLLLRCQFNGQFNGLVVSGRFNRCFNNLAALACLRPCLRPCPCLRLRPCVRPSLRSRRPRFLNHLHRLTLSFQTLHHNRHV